MPLNVDQSGWNIHTPDESTATIGVSSAQSRQSGRPAGTTQGNSSGGGGVITQKGWTIDGREVNFGTTDASGGDGQKGYTILRGPGGYGIQFGSSQGTMGSATVAGTSTGIDSQAEQSRVENSQQTTAVQSGCSNVSDAANAGYVRPYVEDAPDDTDRDGDTRMSG
jgi:hypothetical protein